jgi:Secretion system C-terminal sorting domain
MTKNLLKYLSILTVVLLLANEAFAQVQAGKSRLDIGKKQVIAPSVQGGLHSYSVLNASPNVKLNKPSVVNQYFRNSLLVKTSTPKSSSDNIKSTEANSVDGGFQSGDKLYASEKITVSNIYPNPANDFTSVDYSIASSVNSANLTFFNVLGSQVGSFELDKFDKKLKIQTTDWESGIYLYQLIVDGKKMITKKLLVRHN